MLAITKTLAAYQLARVPFFELIFTDGTSRWCIEMENIIVGFMTDNGYQMQSDSEYL